MENKWIITGDQPVSVMNLRQYYAGLMLQGLMSKTQTHYYDLAREAVLAADVLIEALNKSESNVRTD